MTAIAGASIPISNLVQVTPQTIGAGAGATQLNGLIMTGDTSIPVGVIQQFSTLSAAQAWFAPGSTEYIMLTAYFTGVANSTKLPQTVLMAAWQPAATAPVLYGASLGTMTLTQLKTLSGTIILSSNGTQFTSSSISLSAATSFSNAATIIQAAFTTPTFTVAWDSQRARFTITGNTTGSAATITYATGTLAPSLNLTQTNAAVLQATGTAGDTITQALNRVVALNANFATYSFTTYNESVGTNTNKLAAAAWVNTQNLKYAHIAWDNDPNALVPNTSSTFGATVFALDDDGTVPCYDRPDIAAMVQGYASSIDYTATNGRTNAAFRQQAGLTPSISDVNSSVALLSNNYSYYGTYGNFNQEYNIFYNGACSGRFLWLDSFLDQIYLNNQLTQAFFQAFLTYPNWPFNDQGANMLRNAALPVIQAAGNSGIYRSGVTLSATQAQAVNNQTGKVIDPILSQVGWYLYIPTPTSAMRAARNWTGIVFFYTDGQNVQQITMNSTAIL